VIQLDHDTYTFVPEGARRYWPFVVSAHGAYTPAPWNAHLLLWWGLLRALLRVQPTESRENWRTMPREALATLMHKEGAGIEHPSRAFVATLLRENESILDVGCGAGVGYEALAAAGLAPAYVGIDSSEPSIEIALERYPAGDFRIGSAVALTSQFGTDSFDVVLVRHVLEHLPDFELAMDQAISVARRLAIFVFYLTPRALPFGVRKLDPGHGRRVLYTYVYSRPTIDRYLRQRGLCWRWYDNLGSSRAGWFANERNSALVVSKEPSDVASGNVPWA
jgi:SAM-dependent methyltransferase